MFLYSIIVPIYRVESYLHQCIDSILAQTYQNFELILVDDGSTDNCPVICDSYARLDSRVSVIHQENGGLSDARNAGTKMARGDYVIFVDSDDYWDGTDCLSSINASAQKHVDVILFRAKKLYESTGRILSDRKSYKSIRPDSATVLGELVEKDLFRCSAWSKAVRRRLLSRNGIEFEKDLLGEDIDWYLNVVLNAKSYSFVDRDFYVHRQRKGSITKSLRHKNLVDLLATITKWTSRLHAVEGNKRTTLLKYLAKEYSNLYVVYALVDDVRKERLKEGILALSWLFNYGVVKRTKIIGTSFRTFGFDNTISMIRIASKFRTRA